MLIKGNDIRITNTDILKAFSVYVAETLTYRLKDQIEINKLDKKKDPTPNSMRATMDFGGKKIDKEEIRRFKDKLEAAKESGINYNIFTLARDVALETLEGIKDMKKKARRVKYERMVTERHNALYCFLIVDLIYTAKMIYITEGTTGSIYLDKKLELIDINKSKVSYYARKWVNGEISDDYFWDKYYHFMDIANNMKELNMSGEAAMEMGRETMMYQIIGKARIESGIKYLCETIQESYFKQPRLLETENKQNGKLIEKIIKG